MKTENEKGIAILLSIGFLALISILAMLFIVTSMTNRRISSNYNDLTTARLLAHSAVNRTIASMKLYSGDFTKNFSYVTSNSKTYAQSSIEAREDLISLLPTEIGGVTYYTAENYMSSTDSPTWQYFPSNTSKSTDIPITGRIAFLAIADNGKMMPAAAVDDGWNVYNYNLTHNPEMNGVTEYVSPSSDNSAINDAPVTAIGQGGEKIIGRPGVNVSEIWLGSLGTFLNDTYLKKLSSEESIPGGSMPKGGWGSSDVFFSKLNIKKDDEKEEFLQYFTFGTPPDPEAFWVDANLDDIKTEDELFHRFNLQRTDWNDFTVDSIVNTSAVQYMASDNGNINTCIPWLKNWKLTGNYATDTAWQYQIAANIIDYSDSDSEATTDNEISPTYVGLERCPYINEIKLKIDGNVSENLDIIYYCSIDLSEVSVELVNMYDTSAINTTVSVTVTGSCHWMPRDIDTTFTATAPDFNISINSECYNSDTISPSTSVVFNGWDSWDIEISGEPRSITDFKITGINIKLTDQDNSSFYDYSYVIETETTAETLTSDGSTASLYFSAQVADPRQNLLGGDWAADSEFGTNSSIGTIGSRNSTFLPNPGGNSADLEPNVDSPWEISTAYIRNDPMQSPWELGAIHRGEKWQTINLKLYDDFDDAASELKSYPATWGGRNYSYGDANILNQIKMSQITTCAGKININTPQPKILKALLYGIYLDSGYEVPGFQDPNTQPMIDDTTEIDGLSESEALANDIIAAYSTVSGDFKTRAEVLRPTNGVTRFWANTNGGGNYADENYIWATLPQTNDAKKEEIIGKFINLTKAEATNNIIVIAIAQTIKDVGEGITVNKDLNNDGIIANFSESSIGRDISGDSDTNDTITEAVTGAQYGTYDQYADEITATQKVFVVIYRNPATHEFRIGRFEYLDD